MKTTQAGRSLISEIVSAVSWGLTIAYLDQRLYRELTRKNVGGKVVLITWVSRGLGLAIARELAKRGAHLALCARIGVQLEKADQSLKRNDARY